YERLLRPLVTRPVGPIIVGVLWVVAGALLLRVVEREFIPLADRAGLRILSRAPEGSTIEYTDRYQREVEKTVLTYPQINRACWGGARGIGTPGLVNEGGIFANMTPWEERDRTQMEIVDELRGKLSTVGGMTVFPANLPALSNDASLAPISL